MPLSITIYVFLFFIIYENVEAQDQYCVDNEGLSIVFINGIKTTRTSASKHLSNLNNLNLVNDDSSVEYDLAYNHHENFFVDLFQSNYQIIESQRPGEYWDHLLDLKSYSTNTEINQGISQGTIESIASFIALSNYTNARITGTIQSELDRNRKILIVAHSQGTLYANSSYQAIVENEINKERIPIIGMLHVASVANIVGSSGINIKLADYTSYVDDLIVSNVSIRYNILPALHDVMFGQKIHLFEADHTLHGFSEIYIQPKFADSNNNETLTINNLFNDIKLKMKGISSLLKCPQALGCLAIDGEGLPGKFFTNPDGTEGGFVSNDSTVSPTVYLGAEAEVCNGAQVFGQATIVGPALISDSGTVVNNNAIINGNILVNSGAQILQSAQMLGHSGIGMGAKLTGNAILKDSAVAIGNVKISEDADIGGNSFLVSFGDPQEKVEVKGQVKISGSYIIGQNAKLNGDFIISGGPSAVTGSGVTLSGAGNIISANFSDYVEVDTSNLLADGSGNLNNQSILIFGNAKIFDEPKLSGQTFIFENSTIEGSGQVKDNSFIFGEAIIGGDAIVSGASNISGNCVLETGLFEKVGIPNINNPADPNNQFCPGYYVPDPMALATTNQLKANFVQTSQEMDMKQMREEAYLAYQNMIEESYKMREDFLRGKIRAPASQ